MTDPSRLPSLVPSFRVGITGTRKMGSEQLARLEREVDRILAEIRTCGMDILGLPAAKATYGEVAGSSLRLTLVSPLAEGADRLTARVGLARGYLLNCPLPFAKDDYQTDFATAESKSEYCGLLAQANAGIVELDGGRGDVEARSYEAVGRYVARNCDILIAIWDGKAGRGLGGTADIVRFAVHHGPPVWWIHGEQDVPSKWLIDAEDLRQASDHRPREYGNLRRYMERLLLPPAHHAAEPGTAFERVAHVFKRHEPPAYAALATTRGLSERWIWRAHSWLMAKMAGRAVAPSADAVSDEQVPEFQSPAASFWLERYRSADELAGGYARRYRSSYVWSFAFATLALIVAAVSLVVPGEGMPKLLVTGAELVCLLAIAGIVLANERHAWHRRFLEFRLFAELCRKQQVLAMCGWSLQGASVTAKPVIFDAGSIGTGALQEDSWVPWLFSALQRAAPPLEGRFDVVQADHVRRFVLARLVGEQIAYHENRTVQSAKANARLGQFAEWCFFAVVAIVILKLGLVLLHAEHGIILSLGLAAAILPAISAGFFGIRSYAELSPMADQSRRMAAAMIAAKSRIGRVDIHQPLASQLIGAEVSVVATTMLSDIEGWLQLFSSKIVEPG